MADVFSVHLQMFNYKWSSAKLESQRLEAQDRYSIRITNLDFEHIKNQEEISQGNILRRTYFQVKDFFTRRTLERELQSGPGFEYFLN